ncbi:class I adenylate-forming enzyme family protein [Rhizohabitans arisaemae]|uniref:class I adenylate-forming enzyme family protein n=1 Tax=Rhizohabitans arisaemae TaxID=2720610 RepID=UPI0024B0F332|nr:class I adenylate-forming enzyme family protein [Rhizohabitans arisaemae]
MTRPPSHPADRVARYIEQGWWTGETVDDLLRAQVAARPGAPAVVDPLNKADLMGGEVKRLSWAELDREVDRVAGVLLEQGVGQGDLVAIQLPNSVEIAATFLAVVRIGAVAVPFPVQYREYELTQLGALTPIKAFVTAVRIADRAGAEFVRDLRPRLPALETVLAWGVVDKAPDDVVDLGLVAPDPEVLTRHLAATERDPADLVTVCWTSGTEATPKGVPRCHHDWLAVESICTAAPGLTEADVVLNPFPMVNMAGIGGVFLPWLRSGCVLVQHQPFDLTVYLTQIARERVTYTLAPPPLLMLLLHREEILAKADISSLTRIGSGSAPLPVAMVRGWQERHGIAIINFFGSNEGVALLSDPVHMPDPADRARYFPRPDAGKGDWPGSLAAMRVKLVDPATGERIVEPGIPGELHIDGPTVFAGYYPGTAAADPFDDEGYLVTGDIFEIAGADGRYLRFVDRAGDLIIRGGVNIAPAELEALISGHPAVAETACVGYPDEVLGERVCAFVVAKPDTQLNAEIVVGFLRERGIASYKLPERVEVVAALPRNAVGKILKRDLRDSLT